MAAPSRAPSAGEGGSAQDLRGGGPTRRELRQRHDGAGGQHGHRGGEGDSGIGRDTGIGAIAGVLVGTALGGPPGLAAGLVIGGMAGGLRETHHIPTLRGPAFDEIRKDVPENSSAILLVADPGDVDAMVSAFADRPGQLTRYHLSPEAYAELEAALAGSPPAAPPQRSGGWP